MRENNLIFSISLPTLSLSLSLFEFDYFYLRQYYNYKYKPDFKPGFWRLINQFKYIQFYIRVREMKIRAENLFFELGIKPSLAVKNKFIF